MRHVLRERRRRIGLCIMCGRIARDDASRCDPCRQQNNALSAASHARRRRRGI
jgi:hypothetical protein